MAKLASVFYKLLNAVSSFINIDVICTAMCKTRPVPSNSLSSSFCNENVCTELLMSAIAECDFEENHLCGFVNRWNPNVNWFVGGGNIRNSQSILPKDHTLNSELGKQQM